MQEEREARTEGGEGDATEPTHRTMSHAIQTSRRAGSRGAMMRTEKGMIECCWRPGDANGRCTRQDGRHVVGAGPTPASPRAGAMIRLLVRPRPSCDCCIDSRIVPEPLAIDAHFALALRSRRTPASTGEAAPTAGLASRGVGALAAVGLTGSAGWPADVSGSSEGLATNRQLRRALGPIARPGPEPRSSCSTCPKRLTPRVRDVRAFRRARPP